MTAPRPVSNNTPTAAQRRLSNEQVQQHAEPLARARTQDELVAALDELYRQSRELTITLEPVIARYVTWIQENADAIDDAEEDGGIDIPDGIAAPYDDAAPAVMRILAEHAALVAQWDAAQLPDQLPPHGLPPNSHLAVQFGAQRPQSPAVHRARLTERFDALQTWAQDNMAQARRLLELSDPDEPTDEVIDGLIELEGSYEQLFHQRLALLREWDGAGFGQAVPAHGLEPAAHFHFQNFEALDQQRLAAIAARGDR